MSEQIQIELLLPKSYPLTSRQAPRLHPCRKHQQLRDTKRQQLSGRTTQCPWGPLVLAPCDNRAKRRNLCFTGEHGAAVKQEVMRSGHMMEGYRGKEVIRECCAYLGLPLITSCSSYSNYQHLLFICSSDHRVYCFTSPQIDILDSL